MSTENSSVNSETVEQTKQQIRGLVSEIAQLSKSELGAQEYYAAFMQRIVQALAAVGGAVWDLDENKRLGIEYQINISDTLLRPDSEEAAQHMGLLEYVRRTGEPQLIPPLSSQGDGIGNPTEYLLVLAPLKTEQSVEGVVEIFQRPDSQPATQRGYLRFLVHMCELAGEWLKSRKLKQFSDRHSLWAQADQFARMVHDSLNVRETSYTISNEGRRLIGCDRVSVTIKRGGKHRVEAISGQDTIESRSNIVTSLNTLATRVAATGETLWFTGNTEDLPPQLEEAVDTYVDESYAKSVIVLPLRRPEKDEAEARTPGEAAQAEANPHREIIGALIVEQLESDIPYEVINPRIDLVYEHAARAVSNSLDHNNVFLMPLWRTIGHSRILYKARNLPKTLAITGVILAVILALFLFRTNFNLECKGNLQPVSRREVYTQTGGRVSKLYVKDGQKVKKDDPLVDLTDPKLEADLANADAALAQAILELENQKRRKRLGNLTESERQDLDNRISIGQKELPSLRTQRDLVKQQISHLKITSPMDGMVMMSWDVQRTLEQRPVTPGQRLMTVADPSGEWELALQMPERRMGHVSRRIKESDDPLTVSYVMATNPSDRLTGTIHRVDRSTNVTGEDGPTVRIIVRELDRDALGNPRPGASTNAEVHCGRRSLGYSWFHEAWEWAQMNILF